MLRLIEMKSTETFWKAFIDSNHSESLYKTEGEFMSEGFCFGL